MKTKKKVLFLITKATWGGAQRYVYDLATHLPHEKFSPIVAYGEAGRLSNTLTEKGIETHEISALGRDIALVSDISSFFQILVCLWRVQPDVLHLNSSKAAALGAIAGRIMRVPTIIFTVHGWPFGEKRNMLVKIILWKISWLTALLAHHVICVSDYDLKKARLMLFIGKKAVRIYNGIAPTTFGPGDIIRRAFPAGVKVTGTIGELNVNKNHIELIERAKNDSTMYLAIVGDGELRSTLEKIIKEYGLQERVKLFGYLPAVEVLKGFDTFALPSVKEGLPYVLLEARAASLPIIANRVGGVGEILDARDLREFSLEQMVEKTLALYLPAHAG